jgi:hypothetical protein
MFCQKQAHLKSLGQKQDTTAKIWEWLNDNIDDLYPDFKDL